MRVQKKIARARELRREQTPFEKNLWALLREHQMSGFHFRRQHPIGPYIADFACVTAKLIIELDGDSHEGREESDANRDCVLQEAGWKILRFPNVYARDFPDDLWRTIEIELLARVEKNEEDCEVSPPP